MPDLPAEEPQEWAPAQSEPEPAGPHHGDHAEPAVPPQQAEVAPGRDHDGPFAEQSAAGSSAEPAAPSERPAPRRGSTVREPAPTSFSFGSAFSGPAPVPPAPPSNTESGTESSAESEDAAHPRRAGWWSKRVLGKG
jgi:ribonuclease E